MRVIIADANHADRRLLREIILQLDRRTVIQLALNARQLFDHLKSAGGRIRETLIFLDFDLPGSDAPSLIRGMTQNATDSPLFKVVWGDFLSHEQMDLCLRCGADLCVPKSCRPSDLRRMVGHLFQGRRQTETPAVPSKGEQIPHEEEHSLHS